MNPLVNLDASHNRGSLFTSTVDPRSVNSGALPAFGSNIQSANASKFVGGRINRRKINKISRMYKMKGSRKHVSRKVRRMKSRIRSRFNKRNRRHSRKQKGGYAQFQNNEPMTQTYSTGGPLSPSLSALANPVPYQTLSNCTNCIDNFSKVDNFGFPSKGWH